MDSTIIRNQFGELPQGERFEILRDRRAMEMDSTISYRQYELRNSLSRLLCGRKMAKRDLIDFG